MRLFRSPHFALVTSCALALSACGSKNRDEPGRTQPAPSGQGAQAAGAANAASQGRVVVLGFDGVDPRWLEQWAREGKLPNLARMIAAHEGRAYTKLASTNPPQSPVAWTSFATGTEPGDHGIFDFIARKLIDRQGGPPVLPQVGTNVFHPQPAGPPVARNLRSGEPFWQTLGNQGVKVLALNVPYSFPPDPMRDGRMVSGLGVPDLRETNSTFTYASTDIAADEPPHGGGVFVRWDVRDGKASFALEGPSVPGKPNERMSIPVEARAKDANTLTVTIAGRTIDARVGEFSDWIEATFEKDGTRIAGIFKIAALEAAPRLRLFVSPISFDPRAPYSPVSYPNAYAGALAEQIGGLYKTVGWDHDTSSLNEEVVDDALFLRDMDAIETQRTEMLMTSIAKDDWQLLLWVSTATDRAAHMFYRLIDPQHPRYDAQLAALHGDAIERQYKRMDETIGRVLSQLRPNDTLLIMSDHGFHNYRRGLHVNQWLRTNGFLTLRNGAEASGHEFLLDVDWSQTKAYALGTGQIYFNVRGRERDGIVNASDTAALAQQIREGMKALRDDAAGGAPVVSEVYVGAQAFHGGRASEAPDLQIAFAENYRTSWETILGGVPAGLLADNTRKWSGDHAASDVAETPGILVANRPISRANPAIWDLAPTIVSLFGKPVPQGYVGGSVFVAR